MKYMILILIASLLLSTPPATSAHNLVAVNGKTKQHQHVYRRQEYGKPLQQGHRIQSQGGGTGVVIWGSDTRPEYGKSTVPRNGPIVGDRKSKPGQISKSRKKYGWTVSQYGKPVNGYGKPVRDYGKPDRND